MLGINAHPLCRKAAHKKQNGKEPGLLIMQSDCTKIVMTSPTPVTLESLSQGSPTPGVHHKLGMHPMASKLAITRSHGVAGRVRSSSELLEFNTVGEIPLQQPCEKHLEL